ncbi:MAG: hypothetical protein ACR2OV_07190 [Hyphomicrobiaceae bacterium]
MIHHTNQIPARLALLSDDGTNREQLWPLLPTAALYTLIWLLFASPWLSGAITIPWDAKAHFAPQIQFMAASIARGEWPFWNPFAFSGHPQIADPQAMLFSPPMILLAMVNGSPSIWAIDAVVLAMLLIGGFGVLLLCRDLGWHWAASLLAATGFAFGAAMAWRLQHFGQVFSLAYFPIALWLLRRALKDNSMIIGALAGLVGAFIVLGRDQIALMCIYLLVGYVIWHWVQCANPAAVLRTFWPLAAGGAIGLAVIALPILMTAQLAADSNRPTIDYAGAAAGSLHPALLVTAAVPHVFGSAGEMEKFWGPPSFTWEDTGLFIAQNMGIVYVGAIPYLLIAIGLLRGFFLASEIRYFAVAWLVVLLYALGGYTPFFRLAYSFLPGVDLYRRPADAVFLIGALSAILAAYVAHRLMNEPEPRTRPLQWLAIAALVAAPFALAIAFAHQFDRLEPATRPLLIAALWFVIAVTAVTFALWLKPIRPLLAGALLTLPLGLDVAINNGPNGASALPMEELAMLDANTPEETALVLKERVAAVSNARHRPRVELAGLGFHWPNASLTHGLENTLGYNPVRLATYTAATAAGDTVGGPDQRKFSALFPSYRSLLANLLGLRFIATGVPIERIDDKLGSNPLPLIARTKSAYIYENRAALPRVIFATAARRSNFATILKTGNWPLFDPSDTVLFDEDIPIGLRRPAGNAQIVSYRNTEVVVRTNSAAGGWLVLNDLWHPWWSATVNGERRRIHRANVLFRAVEVGPGEQTVRFTFKPVTGALSALFHPNPK